jgi:signal transduction histidine kinase
VRSLEQVGAKVAHELKNPLAAIKSLLQLEQTGERDERSQRRLDVMTREVARMEGILREYLSFSRPLEDLRLGAVDLAVVADNVLALLEGRAASSGVRLQRSGASVLLAGDARRLEEAVLNLVSNAMEATPSGGAVTVEVAASKCGGLLRVRDTGAGMTPAVLEKLGTPFFTTRKEGNGLGVVLARGVITQHGGQLDFTSRPGAGTTATVTLPQTMPSTAMILPGRTHGSHSVG